jgi:hypothetical protein
MTRKTRRLTSILWRAPALVALLFAVLVPAWSSNAASAATKPPNPCGLAPASDVAVALGVKKAPVGELLPVDTDDGVGNYVCDYIVGHVQLEPQIALLAYGQLSPAGPAGTHVVRPAGLGSKGVELYDTASGEVFADVLFVKDGYRVAVNSTGPISPTRVLTLARVIYDRLT